MVELRDLGLEYPAPGGPVPALRSVSAVFPRGQVSAIVGPSGCGKTSLIHAAAGLIRPTSGEVLIDDEPVRGVRPHTAVIFQHFGLLPWRSVVENAALPLAIRHVGRARRRRLVMPILDELGLAPFADFPPDRLSGGMKQRVALARALAAEPDLLLMDEPFSSLDALTRESAQEFLLDVRRLRPMTVVLVTHSIDEAAYLADSVFVMTGRNPGAMTARFDIPENTSRSSGDFRSKPGYVEACARIRAALKGSAP